MLYVQLESMPSKKSTAAASNSSPSKDQVAMPAFFNDMDEEYKKNFTVSMKPQGDRAGRQKINRNRYEQDRCKVKH